MTKIEGSNIEDLKIVVNSFGDARKALRRVIERGTGEVKQLGDFEAKLRETGDKFFHFKEFVQKNNKQAEILKSRLNQEIHHHRQNAESLKRQIEQLRYAIGEQTSVNDRLGDKYKINIEKLHELRRNSDQTINKTKSPEFIQRLQNELE